MKGLADGDRVDARVRERDLLRRPAQRLRAGDDTLELRAHRVARLDRDHVGAGRQQCAGQLPGAGAKIENIAAGTKIQLFRDPGDCLGRILRPRPLVDVGDELEGPRLGMLQLRHATRDRGRSARTLRSEEGAPGTHGGRARSGDAESDPNLHAARASARLDCSYHLRLLREAGVTRTRAEGTQRFISLRRDDLEERFPGLVEVLTH